MKVYLIRHAQSEENALDLKSRLTVRDYNELLRRSYATPLTAQGEQQARALVEKLSGAGIERIYSSPYTRAFKTATFLSEALNLTPTIVDDLREVLPRPLDERLRDAPLGSFFVRSYLGMLLPGGQSENLKAGYRRAKAAWAAVTAEPAAAIAVVAHRGLNGLILFALQRDRRWRVITRDLSNGGVSLIHQVKALPAGSPP
ncbi:MAG: phosphoglycerate mutase family protein [Chloroflexales bacterium]|nr:phosphoglycerate mutase family protein [Chloroflexales bacterium]